MKQHSRLHIAATALYCAVAVLFVAFFVYVALFENVSVFSTRNIHDYEPVIGYTSEQAAAADAPAGVQNIYRWTLNVQEDDSPCLCFYLVHQHAEVYIEDELVYRLQAAETNRLGGTVSSNWVNIPLRPADHGKEITIILTPLFANMIDFIPEFLQGSHFAIVFDQLQKDMPQLLISLLCILLGFFMIAFQLYFTLRMHTKAWNLFYLGSLSLMLGFWRITDTLTTPVLFENNPMVLGYITIGSLFLCSIPFALFLSTRFSPKYAAPLYILALVNTGMCLFVLLSQILGLAEFKELLFVCHIMLIVTVIFSVVTLICSLRDPVGPRPRRTWKYFILLIVSILLDLLIYYITGTSAHIFFTIAAFVAYSVTLFISTIMDTTKKAYVDPRTGLQNALRWNERMNEDTPVPALTGVIMIDLNDLKGVNDTHGHEAGDQLIAQFANILRNTFPSSSLICRWGGDEFTILTSGMTREKMDRYIDSLNKAVDEHNQSSGHPIIHFAMGHALSIDYPNLTCRELWSVADSKMYLEKQRWHAEHNTGHPHKAR